MTSAVHGQDAVITILAAPAPLGQYLRIVRAAAAASVPCVLPCNLGNDTADTALLATLPEVYEDKVCSHEGIARIGKS